MGETGVKMSPWRQVFMKAKLRQLILFGSLTFAFTWILALLIYYFTNTCNGPVFTKFICDKYHRGSISGNLCPRLCEEGILHRIYLSRCLSSDLQYTVYHVSERVNGVDNEMQLKVKTAYSETEVGKEPRAFELPAQGTRMDQFREMVIQFVDEKIGGGDHKALVDKIMDVADTDKDQKVTLAEAKSIWALLHNNEFFIAMVFADKEYFPQFRGFCGDLFALDYHPRTYLYKKEPESYTAMVFPEHYKWSFPAWDHRAKIMIGLLEFTMDAYQQGSEGTYYMCSLHEENIGYNRQYDIKMSDTSHILSQQELTSYFSETTCKTSQDCQYLNTCQARCDPNTGKCAPNISKPTLYYVCKIIQDYLVRYVPSGVEGELQGLLERCDRLDTTSDVEHSLLLNDLKSLLWKQISDKKVH